MFSRPFPAAQFLFANLTILLLYLPWFLALFMRLSLDASYWQGQLKLGEALRHVAISFISGETVLEVEATRLLAPYGLTAGMALLTLVWKSDDSQARLRTVYYSLLWLILPVAAILVLASLAPKFNARYVMIALPGLILLWSAGLAALWQGKEDRGKATSAFFSFLLLLAGFAYANYNWFTNPAFTKAEWREMIRYIRAYQADAQADGRAKDEAIVLVSGHAWPVWNYYAPDMRLLRLPDLEILDVNAVLDFASTAMPLRTTLLNKKGAWLVEWQDKIVDPMNIVPLQLQLAGHEEPAIEQFWQLKLHHYTNVDANAVLVEPTVVSEVSVNFGNQVYLLDYTVADNGDLLLFWQLHPDHRSPALDLHITGQTFTADGLPFHRLTDRRPASYEYPTFRWRAGQVTLGRIPAEEWAGRGALPGRYRMKLGVYEVNGDLTGLDVIGAQGQPLGKYITLEMKLSKPTPGNVLVNKISFAHLLDDLEMELLLADEQAEPGQMFAAEIHWFASGPISDDYNLSILWRVRNDGRLAGSETLPLSNNFPTSRWPEKQLMRTVHQLRPPLNLASDDYWLEIGLVDARNQTSASYVRAPFRVLGSSRIFMPPSFATKVDMVFGETLRLLGIIEPLQSDTRAGEQTLLTLVWQALERPQADYSATIQWLGADGKPAAQADLALPGGSSNWLPQQVELQSVIATAPPRAGEYELMVAVYDANQAGLPRLLTSDGHDRIDLGVVTVLP